VKTITTELLRAHIAGMQRDYVIWYRSGADMAWLLDTIARMSSDLFRIEGNVPS
jgi:hypothetical protein